MYGLFMMGSNFVTNNGQTIVDSSGSGVDMTNGSSAGVDT